MNKPGALISTLFGLLALGVLAGVFVKNASPYVTIAEARASDAAGIHVAGQIEKGTLQTDAARHEIRFTLKDDQGQTLPVVYTGAPVSSLGSASKVVAIGNMRSRSLHSDQLLVKCPSKYEAAKAGS